MKKNRYKLFSYLFIDRQAAQDELNGMARQGWALDHVLGPFARFRPTERTDLTYFLDWRDPQEPDEDELDYIQLCRDAGWELKHKLDYWNIYASRPGSHPSPIQTDQRLEYQRFQKKALRRMTLRWLSRRGIELGYLLLFSLEFSLQPVADGTTLPQVIAALLISSNMIPLWLVALPFSIATWAAQLIYLGLRLRDWKRAMEQGDPPLSKGRAIGVWKVVGLVRFLFFVLFLLFFLADVLLNGIGGLQIGILAAVFLLIGIISALDTETEQKKKLRDGLSFCALGLVFLLCLFLNKPLRSVLSTPFPEAPIISQYVVRRGPEQGTTLFGSSVAWMEQPEVLTTTSDWAYQVTVSRWRWKALAQWALSAETEGMQPLDGYSGIWWIPDDGTQCPIYVLQQGNTIFKVRCIASQDPLAFLDSALQWLERSN